MANKRMIKALSYTPAYLFLLVLILFSLFPGLWMLLTSIKPPNEVFTSPPKIIADHPTFANYGTVAFHTMIPRAFVNSVIVTGATVALTLLISIPAGYGFSRFRFKGSGAMSTGLLFGQMLPHVVLVTPLFIIFNSVHLINTRTALVIANLSATLPIAVILLKSFFEGVSRELEEAAKIDGCNNWNVLGKIILPVAAPGIISVSIFSFINAWEEFLYALNFTQSSSIKTLPIAIREFAGQFEVDWGGMMSASVIISVPVLLLFLLCNKYFIKGLTDGSVKG